MKITHVTVRFLFLTFQTIVFEILLKLSYYN